jgi:hypothetical protein
MSSLPACACSASERSAGHPATRHRGTVVGRKEPRANWGRTHTPRLSTVRTPRGGGCSTHGALPSRAVWTTGEAGERRNRVAKDARPAATKWKGAGA